MKNKIRYISPRNFKSMVIEKNNRQGFSINLKKTNLTNLKKGDVLIKNSYSCINYKDILICKGNPGLVRKFPHIPGIDFSGIVIFSKSKKFKTGDKVVSIGQPVGVKTQGCWSEYIKLSDRWIEKLPKNISLKNSMIFGTAGFTAMYAILRLIESGIKKKTNSILVTGSSGGVGLFSILILSKIGFKVTALTRHANAEKLLKSIGASDIILQKELDKHILLPLLNSRFSAVIDNLGGHVLSNASKLLINGGKIISVGNVLSNNSNISILPFILRKIEMIGINTETAPRATRNHIWRELAKIQSNKLKKIFKTHKFKDLNLHIKKLIKNYSGGRRIISFN